MVKLKHQHQYALLAACAFALSVVSAPAAAQTTSGAYTTDPAGAVIKSPYNLCWRTSNWTPGAAIIDCDPDLVPKPVAAAPPPPPPVAVAPPPPPVAIVAPPPPKPVIEKLTLATDVFFDFDKAVLKPEGQAKLDEIVAKMSGASLEVIVASGHTDAIGGDSYNQKLSVSRAEAVKNYLVSKGIEPSRVAAEGKGKANPIADNKTSDGRAKNRRVELEVVGTRTQ
jgi:OOP family OmpA-OmpF porin